MVELRREAGRPQADARVDPDTVPRVDGRLHLQGGASCSIELCKRRDADNDSAHDFGKNIIPSIIDDRRVFAFPFRDENQQGAQAYWRDVGTIDAYYEANLDLTRRRPAAQPVRRALAGADLPAEPAAGQDVFAADEPAGRGPRAARRGARQHRLPRARSCPAASPQERCIGPGVADQQLRARRGVDPVRGRERRAGGAASAGRSSTREFTCPRGRCRSATTTTRIAQAGLHGQSPGGVDRHREERTVCCRWS